MATLVKTLVKTLGIILEDAASTMDLLCLLVHMSNQAADEAPGAAADAPRKRALAPEPGPVEIKKLSQSSSQSSSSSGALLRGSRMIPGGPGRIWEGPGWSWGDLDGSGGVLDDPGWSWGGPEGI